MAFGKTPASFLCNKYAGRFQETAEIFYPETIHGLPDECLAVHSGIQPGSTLVFYHAAAHGAKIVD